MAKVYVDPDRLDEFASILVRFARDVSSIARSLEANLRQLGTIWKDQEYERFVNSFWQAEKLIQEFLKEIEEIHPKLREDASYIREYFGRAR
jgi:predicted Holliday junction resolvase-like endonuclease